MLWARVSPRGASVDTLSSRVAGRMQTRDDASWKTNTQRIRRNMSGGCPLRRGNKQRRPVGSGSVVVVVHGQPPDYWAQPPQERTGIASLRRRQPAQCRVKSLRHDPGFLCILARLEPKTRPAASPLSSLFYSRVQRNHSLIYVPPTTT